MDRVVLLDRQIRNYLSQFSDKKHEEIVRLTLLYGIQKLHENYNRILTADELADVLGSDIFFIQYHPDHTTLFMHLY